MEPLRPGRRRALTPDAGFETFAHGADIGVRGWGPTCAVAFEQAALALTSCVTDPERVRPQQTVTVECEAPDRELLLLDWLNALVYEMATRRMLFASFAVTVADGRLSGRAAGEPVDRGRHAPAVEVKGATCTELRVACVDGTWRAQCVIDV